MMIMPGIFTYKIPTYSEGGDDDNDDGDDDNDDDNGDGDDDDVDAGLAML